MKRYLLADPMSHEKDVWFTANARVRAEIKRMGLFPAEATEAPQSAGEAAAEAAEEALLAAREAELAELRRERAQLRLEERKRDRAFVQDDIRTSQEKAELETLKRYKKNYAADFSLETRGRMHLLHQEEIRLMQAQAAAEKELVEVYEEEKTYREAMAENRAAEEARAEAERERAARAKERARKAEEKRRAAEAAQAAKAAAEAAEAAKALAAA